jgi:hypothetical protein
MPTDRGKGTRQPVAAPKPERSLLSSCGQPRVVAEAATPLSPTGHWMVVRSLGIGNCGAPLQGS